MQTKALTNIFATNKPRLFLSINYLNCVLFENLQFSSELKKYAELALKDKEATYMHSNFFCYCILDLSFKHVKGSLLMVAQWFQGKVK